MHFTKLLSLVIFLAPFALQVQAASDACCFCGDNFQCGDGTGCTPYCGQGPCNIFGCACSGGCRGASKRATRSVARAGLAATGETEDRFNAADTDNDGKITFEEWAATSTNADREVLAAHWAKFDSAGVGYLTKADVNSRIA
ncbi:hypothetical protein BD779DRAFT_1787308 [Infundibulicybe gibba]|nr:hypothetical protein BD779DRAFT_1787308 [Infundibulicybe gibba]